MELKRLGTGAIDFLSSRRPVSLTQGLCGLVVRRENISAVEAGAAGPGILFSWSIQWKICGSLVNQGCDDGESSLSG